MTMMESKFEEAGLSPRDMKLGRYMIEFINEGGTYARIHVIADLLEAKKLVRKGHSVSAASSGHSEAANSRQPLCERGDHVAGADKAIVSSLTPVRKTIEDADGRLIGADEAIEQPPSASSSPCELGGQKYIADKSSAVTPTPVRKTLEDADGHRMHADEASMAPPSASSSSCERGGRLNVADKAINATPSPVRKPVKPPNPPRGAAAIRSIQPIMRRGLMWTRSTNDRRLWATVKWYELPGMRRDGNLADILLQRVKVHPVGNSQTIDEIVSMDIFDKAYNDAQKQSDAA
jgi:hypothetical protein